MIKLNRKASFGIQYTALITFVAVALIGAAPYLQRGLSDNWRSRADSIGFGRQYVTPPPEAVSEGSGSTTVEREYPIWQRPKLGPDLKKLISRVSTHEWRSFLGQMGFDEKMREELRSMLREGDFWDWDATQEALARLDELQAILEKTQDVAETGEVGETGETTETTDETTETTDITKTLDTLDTGDYEAGGYEAGGLGVGDYKAGGVSLGSW